LQKNEKELASTHPISPSSLPNYVKGLDGELRSGSPEGITEVDTLGFMDAGAELNIPYYPLFRRNVDCIIALDASADSHDLWFTKAEAYAKRRGLSTWPQGARWPAEILAGVYESTIGEDVVEATTKPTRTSEQAEEAANRELAEEQEEEVIEQATKQVEAEDRGMPDNKPRSDQGSKENIPSISSPGARGSIPHSSAYVWIGSSTDTNGTASHIEELDEEELASRDGLGIVYMPLIPNEQVPGFNPADIGTFRFELTPEETENLLTISKSNFLAGEEKIVKVLKAMWLRKKKAREQASKSQCQR
jgi:phospholipase A2